MKRCPNGSRRVNGNCVKKTELTKKRCPNGTRKRNGECVKKSGVRKRCPNGTRRHNGECIKKTTPKRKTPSSTTPKRKSDQYVITVHNSNGSQIKDMDFSVDEPQELINNAEKKIGIYDIVPLEDKNISDYNKIMGRNPNYDINNEELASIWYCKSSKDLNSSYDVKYDNKVYIFKFHPF